MKKIFYSLLIWLILCIIVYTLSPLNPKSSYTTIKYFVVADPYSVVTLWIPSLVIGIVLCILADRQESFDFQERLRDKKRDERHKNGDFEEPYESYF